jgi:hypothetical protein
MFILVTFVFSIISSLPSAASPVTKEVTIAASEDLINTNVEREVTITRYGLIVIKDNYKLYDRGKKGNQRE